MKTVKLFLSLLFLVQVAFGQTISNAVLEESYWSFTPRFGYDFPTYDNNTPFIDYDGGISAGISVDKYWKWFGVGADFDYIKNAPVNTFPTTEVYSANGLLDLKLSSTDITRMFYGIGPSFKYQSSNNKFIAELNTRAGLSTIDGGRLLLEDPAFGPVNFHAGYDQTSIFATKAQLRFNYFFTPNFGAHIGGYFLNHYNVPEENENGVSAFYYDYEEINDVDIIFNQLQEENIREKSCNCNISSIGVFAGLSFKIPAKSGSEPIVCAVCGKDHTPHCCATCGCDISITARDKYSQQVLADTDVVLKDAAGNIVETGTTNNYGVVVFKEVKENNYTVEGKLYDVELEETTITLDDFVDCKQNGNNIQKEIIYADLNFILKGDVVECNTEDAISGVDIQLRDKQNSMQSNTLSDNNGEFIFYVKQASTYLLKGNKNGYFSNEVSLTTSEYDRNETLTIDFKMCVNPCGEAIKLDNIHFNRGEWDILPESWSDLNYVVKLMQENPEIKVEMTSHTDSRGSHSFNQELSQKRAQSTVDYIVNKGIARNRLIAKGLGETELLNRCADGVTCSEEEHRINRRTEFKVICID